MKRFQVLVHVCVLLSASMAIAQAAPVIGGNALIEFNGAQLLANASLTPVWFYGSNNGAATATQTEINAVFFGGGFQGGGAAIAPSAIFSIDHPVLTGPVSNPTGRGRQSTNADLDPSSPAATWSIGEQIGLDGVTVFTSSLGGGIANGDFSLTYSSALNRLSLVNNYQFVVEAFRVDNPTFTPTVNGFTVQGNLLTGDFFPANGLVAGLEVGDFTFNAITTAIPEPSSLAILGASAGAILLRRRRRSLMNSLLESTNVDA